MASGQNMPDAVSDDEEEEFLTSESNDEYSESGQPEQEQAGKSRKRGYFSNLSSFPVRWLKKTLKFLGEAFQFNKSENRTKHHLVILVHDNKIIVEGSDEIVAVAIENGFAHYVVNMADEKQACNYGDFDHESKFGERLSQFKNKRDMTAVLTAIGFFKLSKQYKAAYSTDNPEDANLVVSEHMLDLLHRKVRLDHEDRSQFFRKNSYQDVPQNHREASTVGDESRPPTSQRSVNGKFASQNKGKTISMHEVLMMTSSQFSLAHCFIAFFFMLENAQEGANNFFSSS